MERKVTSHITKGLIISVIIILISLVAYLTDQQQATWAQWAGNIVLFGGVIWACISYGKEKDGFVTYGNVFAHGFKVSAIVALIVIVYTIIFFLIFPDVKEEALETAREQMLNNPNMTEDQVDTAIDFTSRFFYVFAIGGILFFYLLIGVIAALIGAAITRRKPHTPFENQPQP